jgi:hypothetical protein
VREFYQMQQMSQAGISPDKPQGRSHAGAHLRRGPGAGRPGKGAC